MALKGLVGTDTTLETPPWENNPKRVLPAQLSFYADLQTKHLKGARLWFSSTLRMIWSNYAVLSVQ